MLAEQEPHNIELGNYKVCIDGQLEVIDTI